MISSINQDLKHLGDFGKSEGNRVFGLVGANVDERDCVKCAELNYMRTRRLRN